ncbi:MAG TPA: TylF/MycF/NovP-related O-methyltransferase [Methanofastidiosum sp.]|nr:TylF/MycF/NovP-related O-methyltransferase [Methanofastidiosum sp.]
MNSKARLRRILLTFPFLYILGKYLFELGLRVPFINYESGLSDNKINDLLFNLEKTIELKGNIIECGSYLCGTSIIMANYLIQKKVNKIIYACDSFEGFDENELKKEREMNLTNASDYAFTITSYDYVKKKIKKLDLENIIIPLKGFFIDTLPKIKSDYCLIFIDCDLSESIYYSAHTLWPQLVPKGRIVFDDYVCERYNGAKIGIDKFVNQYRNQIEKYGIMKNGLFYVIKK